MRHWDLSCLLRFALVLLGWSAAQGLVADELYYPGPGTQWEQRAPDPLACWVPTAEDGARGMKFIEAVVESSRADGRWVDARLSP